jgi:hypothetical protein
MRAKRRTAAEIADANVVFDLICHITDKAVLILDEHNIEVDRMHVMLDLLICHKTIVPLRLLDMLNGSEADLLHDVCGLMRHLDRENYKLNDCFLPRYARMEIKEHETETQE